MDMIAVNAMIAKGLLQVTKIICTTYAENWEDSINSRNKLLLKHSTTCANRQRTEEHELEIWFSSEQKMSAEAMRIGRIFGLAVEYNRQ